MTCFVQLQELAPMPLLLQNVVIIRVGKLENLENLKKRFSFFFKCFLKSKLSHKDLYTFIFSPLNPNWGVNKIKHL